MIFAALTTGLALLFGEVGARALVPPALPSDVIALDADPDLIWTLGTDKTRVGDFIPNSIGLRGPEVPLRNAGRRRILTLGDSSIYGDGVTYVDVFSNALAAAQTAAGRPMDAIDGGVPGYSSEQALGLYDRIRKAVDPDIVIVGTLWSDSRDSLTTDAEEIAGIRRRTGSWGAVTNTLQSMEGNSSLVRGVRMLLDGSMGKARRVQKIGWVHAEEAGTVPEPPDATERTRVPLPAYRVNLRKLAAAARADGALPVFLLLPHPFDDAARALPDVQRAYREGMRAVATEAGVPLVDCEAWFKTHPSMAARFWDDIHPNASGHAAIADAVSATLHTDRALAARIGAPSR